MYYHLKSCLKKISYTLFIFFLISTISANNPLIAANVEIYIQKASSSPKIDGFLEESFWENIIPLEDFVQYDPYTGKPPSEKTLVYLAFDEDNLYIAFNSQISYRFSRTYNEEKKQMFGKKPVW